MRDRTSSKAALKQFKINNTEHVLRKYLGAYEMDLLEAVDDYISDVGMPATTMASERFSVLSDYTNFMVAVQSILCAVEIQQKSLERDKLTTSAETLHNLIEECDIKNASERSSIINKDARVIEMALRFDEVNIARNYVLNKYNLLVYIVKIMQTK
jgi:hypothetical protein